MIDQGTIVGYHVGYAIALDRRRGGGTWTPLIQRIVPLRHSILWGGRGMALPIPVEKRVIDVGHSQFGKRDVGRCQQFPGVGLKATSTKISQYEGIRVERIIHTTRSPSGRKLMRSPSDRVACVNSSQTTGSRIVFETSCKLARVEVSQRILIALRSSLFRRTLWVAESSGSDIWW